MARQKTKFEDRFKSGGDKETSKEASLFGDPELEETPEFKCMHLLMDQIDELTDVVNANDAASGSYATLKKEYITTSGSFSTRVTANDAKTPLVIGTRSTEAKAGNTTTISTAQAELITALAKGVTNATGHNVKLTLNDSNALVISINRSTYTISADR